MNTPYEIQSIVNLLRFEEKIDYAKPCKDNEPRKEGHWYYCNYWKKAYKVLKVVDHCNYQTVTVQWEDGKINTHCTPLCSQDWHFIPATSL